MKIEKFIKDKSNKYKVIIDDEKYTLYDDVIVKYNLISKKEITKSELDNVLSYNDELVSYYESIKYITKRLRCESEIRDFLHKKNIEESIINKTINKLKENKFLNDEIYIKAYINDQINLSSNGPFKIKKNLLSLNFLEENIDEYLNNIDNSVWEEKVEKYINKKINSNHSNSAYILKAKIQNELINLGYDKELILYYLDKASIDDAEIRNKEYNKIRKSLENKYSESELEYKIKEKMYRKGFRIGD